MTAEPRRLRAVPRAARLATNVLFFVNGLAFATWGVHVPTFKHLHGLNEAEVALAMFAAGVGALVAVLGAGALVGRFGARTVCAAAGLLTGAAIGAVLWLPSYGAGVASLFVFGFFPRLLTQKITPDAQKIVSLAAPVQSAGKSGVPAIFSENQNPKSEIRN